MAVLRAKPQKIVEFYLGLLNQSLVAPLVITRANGEDFKGSLNDTVTLRIGGLRATARDYEFRTRTAPIQFDDIQGGEGIDIKLDTHITSGTILTDEHYTLDDIDFVREVIEPQMASVAGRIEAKVVAGLRAANVADTLTFGDNVDPFLVALEAKRLMDAHKVAPTAGRTFLVGSNVAAQFLASDRLSRYDSVGVSGTPALRDAIIGQLAGSPVVEVSALDPNEAFYLHKTAAVVGNVAPDVPRGVVAGTRLSRDGWAARWIADYDGNYVRDRSIVSTFLGVNDVRDERQANGDLVVDTTPGVTRRNVRLVKLDFTGTASVLTQAPVV
ncbi:MAG: hypothetical protein H7288_07280 [Kineosporiaceae bacterium]|nr:hypothetical protein [Aeromicrobium sp.]